ncbi:cation:proton antiporter [candidate division WOR-3 bacterium]|nr:cation:proton antiporter [candidate division WOR-3 bacterium]
MNFILLIGIIILAGLVGKKLSNRIKLPGVTGYLIVGVLLGQSLLNLINIQFLEASGFITDITLGIVGFIIGNQLAAKKFKKIGKRIPIIVLTESFGAFILVSIAIFLLTRRIDLALLLGAIAPATAPAGTVAVLREYRAKGNLTNSLLAVAGLDDGLCIMIYVFVSAIIRVTLFSVGTVSFYKIFISPLIHILLSLVIGGCAGLLLTLFIRKIRTREETMIIVFGFILLFTGISNLLNISLILVNLSMGIVVANLSHHLSTRLSRILDETVPIVFIVFFVLAGAHLDVRLLPVMGLLGLFYIIFRSAGKIGGASFGAFISKAPKKLKKYLGFGLLSQAGVAIGLSLLVVREFSTYGQTGQELSVIIVTTIAATTVIFEIIGPITTKIAITKAGEVRRRSVK